MQGREEEILKLYEILDKEGMDVKVDDRYMESVRRRLSREYTGTSKTSSMIATVAKSIPKPKVRVFGVRKKEEKTIEAEKEGSEVESLFEVEKPSEEKVIKVEEEMPKDRFVDILSKVGDLGRKDAERIYESGYTSLKKLMESEPKEIARKVKGLDEKVAERLKEEVPKLLPKAEEEFDQMYLLKESKREGREVERKILETGTEFKEELPEWLTIEKSPRDEEPPEWKELKEGPYRYEDYTLYKVERKGKVEYVFSKKPVKNGKPCQIPKGYVVRIDRKGKPSLEKIK